MNEDLLDIRNLLVTVADDGLHELSTRLDQMRVILGDWSRKYGRDIAYLLTRW